MQKNKNLKIILITVVMFLGMVFILLGRTRTIVETANFPEEDNTEIGIWVNNASLPPGFDIAEGEKLWLAGTDTGYGIDAVLWIKNQDTGIYHLFLPPSANLSNIKVWHKFSDLTLDGISLVNGDKTDAFRNGGQFTLKSETDNYTIEITQSENVGAIFLVTDMPLRFLHEAKDNRSPGTALIVSADGEIEYSDIFERLNGRGNTSWNHIKKPYNIKFPKAISLFGMTKAKKYSIIANAQDETMLRHKIAYDLASAIGLPYSPKSFFVELYICGEYLGAYQLTEKIEIGKNYLINDIGDLEKLTAEANENALNAFPFHYGNLWGFENLIDPEDITGPYLLEGYYKPEDYSGFKSFINEELSGEISINSPQYATLKQVEYIRDFYNKMEEAIFSPTGKNAEGKHFIEYLNIESAAKMYLLQEYCKNLDGGNSSFYMWKAADSDGDGKLHFGPIWDFDNTFGNGSRSWNRLSMDLSDPEGWWMKESTQRFGQKTIFYGLLQHDIFINEVMDSWPIFSEAVKILLGRQKSDDGVHSLKSIDEYAKMMESSVDMNFMIVNKIVFSPDGRGDEFTELRRNGKYSDAINYLTWFAEERFIFMTKEGHRKGFN